jgi:hypothetical protein
MIKSFQIGAKTYTVELEKNAQRYKDKKNDLVGRAMSPLGKIVVWDEWDGEKIPDDQIEQTIFHEMVHTILNEMNRFELSENEEFVQTFSLLLHQAIRTAK